MILCDMHSHILPGMDDGCKTPEESLAQLRACTAQDIRRVCLTPHYYHREPIEDFLKKRDRSYALLREAMDREPGDYPELVLGAEVAYFRGMEYEENLSALCLGNSDYLLLEMPFTYWTPSISREVESAGAVCGVRLILAHLERYLNLQDKKSMQPLLETNALIQMNAEYILEERPRRRVKNRFRDGLVDLLGSDCHNLEERRQNLGPGCEELCRMGLEGELHRIMHTANRIFDECI